MKVFFEDEGRFGRINKVSRCWVPADSRAIVCQQFIREYTYAFSALWPASGESYSSIAPLCNTEAMNRLLQGLSQAYGNDQLLLILDGAGWHKSKDLKQPSNIALLLLPPYAPERNPVEHLWDYIREQKQFNNYGFHSMDDLENQLHNVLAQLQHEKQYLQSLCSFNWMTLPP